MFYVLRKFGVIMSICLWKLFA